MKHHSSFRNCCYLILGIVLFFPLLGCGSEEFELAPVSGRVTLGGNPVIDAQITYQPIAERTGGNISVGPGSYGRTDTDGRYTLRTVDNDRPGAVVGQHSVVIAKGQDTVGQDTDISVPVVTNLPSNAGDGSLRITIASGGTESADFDFSTTP